MACSGAKTWSSGVGINDLAIANNADNVVKYQINARSYTFKYKSKLSF